METVIDWGLLVLKFLSIGLTGVFGVMALLVQYKDANGNITRWGRIALIGVLGSTGVAATTTGLELLKGAAQAARTAKQTLEQTQKTARIIDDINRSLHPLKDIEFSFWANVSLQNDELQGYRLRVLREIDAFVENYKKGQKRSPDGVYASISDNNGLPKRVHIPVDSSLFPSRTNEPTAYYLLRYLDYGFAIYRKPIASETFTKSPTEVQAGQDPDLEIPIDTSEQNRFGLGLEYDLESKAYEVRASSIKSDPRYWSSNGSIVSTLDLAGAQIFIFTRSIMVPSLEGNNSSLLVARGDLRLRTLVMNIAGGQQFWFREHHLKEFSNPNGLKYFVINVPNDFEKLNASAQ